MSVPVSFSGSGAVLSLLLAAKESDDALTGLSTFDGGHDLAVYYTYLLVLLEDDCYILHPEETDELSDSHESMLYVRGAPLVVVFGLIAYTVTYLFSESTRFFQKALYAFTIYGACITPSLVAGLLWKRATEQGAIASICCGAVVTLAWNEIEAVRDGLPPSLAELDAVLPAITLSLAMLIIVSLMTRPSDLATTDGPLKPKELPND